MEYVKKHTSEKRDVHVLEVFYNFRGKWTYSSKDIEMQGYFEEEVVEVIQKIRDICAITKQGEEACKKAFDGEDSIIITLKNGISFPFELMSVNGEDYPLIEIDDCSNLTYFDERGDEFKVKGW